MDPTTEPALTLLVETSTGVFIRPVAHALPLPAETEEGPAAEEAVGSCAAAWGLPDFVYRPVLRRVASGNRELGDRILLMGRSGLVVQIKRRVKPTNAANREEAWIRKATRKARRQALGTIRALSSGHHKLVNGRNREISVDPAKVDWATAIIIDHDDPPEGLMLDAEGSYPEVVILRRDWEFLFGQLRSSHAVVEYLKRASSSDPIDLGREPVRYYELAAADAATPPRVLDPTIIGGGSSISAPLLPQMPVAAETNGFHSLLRVVLEDIAISPVPEEVPEEDRLAVLSEIDSLPVAHRAELGELLLSMLDDVSAADSSETKWRFRRYRFPPAGPHLAFGACSRFSDSHFEAFRQWVMLRRHEFGADLGSADDLVTVGVLLTPRTDGLRPWHTTMVRIAGNLELTPEELKGLEELWSSCASVPNGP